ncbi:MAG: HNH endonuclease family protein [Bifidobacteriaceae bacterium]|nr:HNH endonuclease family protein [Bifidobacteriaceae bacterium]MCI1914329.1 HNH endonuclease family protein [Bifidobacteriaceae bacterium]
MAGAGFSRAGGLERLLILIVVAIVIGVTVGVVLPRMSPRVGQLTGEYRAVGNAAETLETLRIVERPHSHKTYDRDAFGYQKTDDDGDGCTIREDVLARDLTDITHTGVGECKVRTGTLKDPYTGTIIHFVRGVKTSAKVQIDHVVALSDAWKSGASAWDSTKLYRYGNDSYNMLAVDGPANEDKGDASAAYWLPPNIDFHCDYVARQIGVKAKYKLSVTSSEKQAMLKVLHGCPGEAVPRH